MQFTVPLRTLTKRFISWTAPTALLSSTRTQSTSEDWSWAGTVGHCAAASVKAKQGNEQWRDKEEKNCETEDYRKYYENYKPSPLSKVERKPIIRAMDHASDENEFLLIRETVDDALRRAEKMWWAAKVWGDHDSPQARALARMHRERYSGQVYKANIA